MLKKIGLLIILIFIIGLSLLNAGEITLKDGKKLTGKIIVNNDIITIRTNSKEIYQINKKDISELKLDDKDEQYKPQKDNQQPIDNNAQRFSKNPVAVIETNLGDITVLLLKNQAPLTVENFITLAKEEFYKDIYFHRVIDNFMIQVGDPRARIKPTDKKFSIKQFADEINADALGLNTLLVQNAPFIPQQAKQQLPANITVKQLYERQGYKYITDRPSTRVKKGVLASANAGPNTNSTQFFITVRDCDWLDGKHTVFGEVIKGYEVVEKISKVKTQNDKPIENVVIKSVKIIE